jgi:hypothetical protein
MMNAPAMTEHKKLRELQDRVEVLHDFLQLLDMQGYSIVLRDSYGEITETLDTSGGYVYNYFGIDPSALEVEREQAVRWALEQ